MKSIDRLRMAGSLVRRGRLDVLWKEVSRRLRSRELVFGLRKEVSLPVELSEAPAFSARPVRPDDVEKTLSLDEPNLTLTELKERMRRRLLIQHRVPKCYVVVDEDDEPIYLQWVICPADNDRIQEYFGGGFPRLEDDEMMIENAYMRLLTGAAAS